MKKIVYCGGVANYIAKTTKPRPKPKPKRKAVKMVRFSCFHCAGNDPRDVCRTCRNIGYCMQCNGWGYLWRKAVKR